MNWPRHEVDDQEWSSHADALRDPSKLPRLLATLDSTSCPEPEFQRALEYVESAVSDLGVPTSLVPRVTCRLIRSVLMLTGSRRTEVLSLAEELTCGRGSEGYTSNQVRWLAEARHELALGFHLWAHLAETSEPPEATICVDLLAYVAEAVPELRQRVTKVFRLLHQARPELVAEIDTVSTYFPKQSK